VAKLEGNTDMSKPRKTLEDNLRDAQEIIRQKNLQEIDFKRTIAALQREDDSAEAIRQEIWALAAHNPEPPTWISGKSGKLGSRGCPLTVWSDWHHGEVVNPDEVNGINDFNAKISKARAFRLFDTTVDLAYNHMGRANTEYPGIIVMLGGDMIGGDIHEELLATNDRTPHQSVNDLTDIIAAGIEKMASKFGKVYVPTVVGNHGRSTKKMRMKGRVFTNYDWSIYCNLARYFKKEKHIRIDVPNTADAHFNSYGTRYMLTHGDSLGVKGGDGIIGAIGPIMRGSLKVGRSEAQMGRDFDELVICHWHQALWLPGVTVNNALKGYDEYAMLQLRAPYSRPSQLLWFNHPEHGTTARWEIFLEGKKKAAEAKSWVSWKE
jgi:hypothetical protein